MRLLSTVAGLIAFWLAGSGWECAWSQSYPSKTIRILTSEAGGGNDFGARILAQALTASLTQQVIVENRPARLIGEFGLRASPDGYTLFVAGSSFVIGTLLQKSPYDPVRDFSYITMLARAPNVLVVHPALAARTVKDMILLAKEHPAAINYATGGAGSSAHLAAELFKSMTGLNIVRINYKGSGPALNDLIAGQVQLMFASASSTTAHVKSGRLRALASGSAQPSRLLPDLPTVAATVPGYESSAISALFAPAKTPMTLITRLHKEAVRTLSQADVKERFFNTGVETVGDTPSELTASIKAELVRMGKVIREAGIRAE